MKDTLDPFITQYYAFMKVLSDNALLRFGTLGPQGTGSHQALQFLKNQICGFNRQVRCEMTLRSHFDLVYEDLEAGRIDYAIVPSAYEGITEFFWNNAFQNNLNFIFPTPEYGIVCRTDYDLDFSVPVTVATCQPVANIIDYLSDGLLNKSNTTKLITASTTEAVISLLDGKADLAVTNQTSFDLYQHRGLMFIFKKYHANIVWSLFQAKPVPTPTPSKEPVHA